MMHAWANYVDQLRTSRPHEISRGEIVVVRDVVNGAVSGNRIGTTTAYENSSGGSKNY
jgi:hypothetical protein